MLARPAFASRQEQVSRIGDADFWWPYVAEILAQHGLTDAGVQPVAGHNATYPTFLCGEVVVKLFGNSPWWRGSHEAERAALALVAADPEILAPRLLGAGQLFEAGEATWPGSFDESTRCGRRPRSPRTRRGRRWTSQVPPGAARCRRTWSPRSMATSPDSARLTAFSCTAIWSPITPTWTRLAGWSGSSTGATRR